MVSIVMMVMIMVVMVMIVVVKLDFVVKSNPPIPAWTDPNDGCVIFIAIRLNFNTSIDFNPAARASSKKMSDRKDC